MATLLEYSLEKRRNRTSSSDESSSSPEPKRPKNDQDIESEDEILTAFNMAEGLHKTLEDINKKLEKLDAIQTTVNQVQASLRKLEGRIQKLETAETTASHDVEKLKADMNDATKERKEKTTQSLKQYQDRTDLAFANLKGLNDDFHARVKELEDKNLYLEAYSGLENLKFENIIEEGPDKEDTESFLRT